MKTTLIPEPDVARELREQVRRTGKGMEVVVNEALRRWLGLTEGREEPPPFEVRPHSFGFRPGVDKDHLNRLADALESEEVARMHTNE